MIHQVDRQSRMAFVEPIETALHRPSDQQPSCCDFYEQDWVQILAEDSFHPGGEDLTRRTVGAMDLPAGARIVDLGCGTGTTALLLAREFGLSVSAIDRSAANIHRAEERWLATDRESGRIDFCQADATLLPFRDQALHAALAECSFSLFADKSAALREIRRVLKTGVSNAGFKLQMCTDESKGLISMISRLKRNLLLLGAGAVLKGGVMPQVELATIKHWMDRFHTAVGEGKIQYLRFNLRCT
jgi:ubiquinone/menaquinone biosynthesis C-methylase UbiE